MTNQIELNTSELCTVEFADGDSAVVKRAIVKIPIINFGDNSKNLRWTEETMSKVAHMFRGVPFRYDINGQNEGSHTKDRLSSPFYDVGWTYSDERGAYYDPVKKTIWVQGEVTHPDVVEKLRRTTSDGKREINFASMGALLSPQDTKCSICGKSPFGVCSHARGETYNGDVCSMIPTNVTKALHVALTNDPADKNAEIAEAIFQDMSSMVDNSAKDSPVPVAPNLPGPNQDDQSNLRSMVKAIMLELMKEKMETADHSKEDIKMADEEKKKKVKVDNEDAPDKVEEKVEKKTQSEVNDDKEKSVKEDDKKKKKVETAEASEKKEDKAEKHEDSESKEEEDEEKKKKPKKEKKEKEEEIKDEKEDKFEKEMSDAFEIKIKGPASKPTQQVITQDNSQQPKMIVETASNDVYAKKYKAKLVQELADTYVKLNKVKSKDDALVVLQDKSIEQLEIFQEAFDGIAVSPQKQTIVLQDNNQKVSAQNAFTNDVPEFGGMEHVEEPYLEVQDMSAAERRNKFGEYGSFDLCFNPQNAMKYKKNK